MAGDPGALQAAPAQTRYSADGFWWWDGAQWRPAYSQDRLWRWTGQTWEPASRPGAAGGGNPLGLIVGMAVGLIILVALMAAAFIYYAGSEISNVFSNLMTTPTTP